MKKTYQILIAFLLICGSVFCDRVWLKIKASNENNWVYSVNNVSADANGNINVTAINNKTVNSNVPSTADFAQYNQNSTDISAIITRLNGLTATADKVASGYTFVGTNGLLQTGTLDISSPTPMFVTNWSKVGTLRNGGAFTVYETYVATTAYEYTDYDSAIYIGATVDSTPYKHVYIMASSSTANEGGSHLTYTLKDAATGTQIFSATTWRVARTDVVDISNVNTLYIQADQYVGSDRTNRPANGKLTVLLY